MTHFPGRKPPLTALSGEPLSADARAVADAKTIERAKAMPLRSRGQPSLATQRGEKNLPDTTEDEELRNATGIEKTRILLKRSRDFEARIVDYAQKTALDMGLCPEATKLVVDAARAQAEILDHPPPATIRP